MGEEKKQIIFLASDHAGFALKSLIIKHLEQQGFEVNDLGPHSDDRVDYPDYAAKVGQAITDGKAQRAILICGSGVGVCMAANKFSGVRAVNANNIEVAKLSRQHNDANVLCLGQRLLKQQEALGIVDAWLNEAFEGGRHAQRVTKLNAL